MSDVMDALDGMPATRRSLNAGQLLFQVGDVVAVLHLVQHGCVQLVRHDPDGSAAVVQRAHARSVLAESSIFSDRYHCSAEAVSEARVALIPMVQVRARLANDPEFASLLARHLAREVQSLRGRAEILTRKTVAQRLEGWLAVNGGVLPERGSWNLLAADVGVTPEALYRELHRRRRLSS